MEVIPASADEIAVFKMAAAETYKKAGIEPKIAVQLFERTMAKMGADLGLVQRPALTKKASAIADKIAAAMGRQRK